ncbi:MAG: hypothetical protein JNN00_10105 [Chitinophagaceae bacterium]|nr:hypothetical protein [Chitinophagaceae bacterium]
MSHERKKYFLQQYLQLEYKHGGVGGADAERILLSKGFKPVMFPHQHSFSLAAKISRFLFLIRLLFRIKKGSVIIFLFPVYAAMSRILLNWLRKKEVTIVCFIADINGLKDGNGEVLKNEIAFFRQFDHFIVHNDAMKEWVKKNISAKADVVSIGFFDFLTKPVNRQREISGAIVFAGNLEKSTFLNKLHLLSGEGPSLHFHLYGPGITDRVSDQDNVTYHGVERPHDLPGKLAGSFGLLWDGDSIDKPGGSLGEYMQYISHHKLSLYILSKLPIILPSSAATASFVEGYKIGFTVNSLYEIEGKIKALSARDYLQMQANMQPLADKISRGECLGNAIDEILRSI